MWKLLVVDSDVKTIDIIKLEECLKNYAIFSALHGGEALEILENHVIDCIIIDMNLSHVSGLEIIDLLRRNTRRPWIIATCLRSNPQMDYPWLELAISIGADEVLFKPYCPEQLLNRIAASIFEVQKKGARLFAPGQQTDRNLLLHSAAF